MFSPSSVPECSCSLYVGGDKGPVFSFEENYTLQPSQITEMTIYLRTAFGDEIVLKGYVQILLS